MNTLISQYKDIILIFDYNRYRLMYKNESGYLIEYIYKLKNLKLAKNRFKKIVGKRKEKRQIELF